MPLTIGINHVTAVTADLDRLVRFYSDMFDAEKVFEGQAANGHPRMAIVELGGTRYVKIVESRSGASAAGAFASVTRPATERFGLAVESHDELRDLRDRMIKAGAQVGEIERLPTQWIMKVIDPDGALLQVCAHARPGHTDPARRTR
jgi:catechol 2,3-dioxygenase-like lactoylglutathione lyase family enzyme